MRPLKRSESHTGALLRVAVHAASFALCVGVGVACTAPERVNEYLDSETGVSVRSMAKPFVYARAVRDAADRRDFISIGAVEVDRMGNRREYLALVLFAETPHPPMNRIVLAIDGKPQEFALATREPRILGIGAPPFRPLWGYAGELWYDVTPADLEAFAAAPPDSIELVEGDRRLTYFSFERADEALKDFIGDIPAAGVASSR